MGDKQKQIIENNTNQNSNIEERLDFLKNKREKTLNDFRVAYTNIQDSEVDNKIKHKQILRLKNLFEKYLKEKWEVTSEARVLFNTLNISSWKEFFSFIKNDKWDYSEKEINKMKKNIDKYLKSETSLGSLSNTQIGWLLSNVYIVWWEYSIQFKNKLKQDTEWLINIAKNWDHWIWKIGSISQILQVEAKHLKPMIRDLISCIKEAVDINIDKFLESKWIKSWEESDRIKRSLILGFQRFEKDTNESALTNLINSIWKILNDNWIRSTSLDITNLVYEIISLNWAQSRLTVALIQNENPDIVDKFKTLNAIENPKKRAKAKKKIELEYAWDILKLEAFIKLDTFSQNEQKFTQSEKLLKEVKDDEKLSEKLIELSSEWKTITEIEKTLEKDIEQKKLEDKKNTENKPEKELWINKEISENNIEWLKNPWDSMLLTIWDLNAKIEQTNVWFSVELWDNSKIKCQNKEELKNILDTCTYISQLWLNSIIPHIDKIIKEIKIKWKSESLDFDIKKWFSRIELTLLTKTIGNNIFKKNSQLSDKIPNFSNIITLEKIEETFKSCWQVYPNIGSFLVSQWYMDKWWIFKLDTFVRDI